MKFVNWSKTQDLAVKQVGKYAVYISNNLDLDEPDDMKVFEFVRDTLKSKHTESVFLDYMFGISDGGLFFFESSEEAWDFYHIFQEELTDSSGLYAAIFSPIEGCLTENT